MMSVPDGVWPILLTPYTEHNQIDKPGIDSLLDFYKQVGVDGVLALGQASEVLLLNNDERFLVAECVAKHSQHLPIVTVGNFGDTLDEQAISLNRVVAMGTPVVVVALSLLPSAEAMDEQLLELAAKVNGPLGIYELPEPEHRLLTPEQVTRIAQAGRFIFMKDTCRQVEPFSAKVKAAAGTPLKLFQANLKVLPPSMDVGGCGFCGWMPIIAPELCKQVVSHAIPKDIRQKAHDKLMDFQAAMVAQGFPSSGKYLLTKRGVKIETSSRAAAAQIFSAEGAKILDNYIETHRPFEPVSLSAV